MSVETIRSIPGFTPNAAAGGAAEVARPGEASFAEALGSAIGKVDRLQIEADREAEKVALGGGNLHEMSMALEKADVAMRLAMKVRNKVVEAYQEIMRMGV